MTAKDEVDNIKCVVFVVPSTWKSCFSAKVDFLASYHVDKVLVSIPCVRFVMEDALG